MSKVKIIPELSNGNHTEIQRIKRVGWDTVRDFHPLSFRQNVKGSIFLLLALGFNLQPKGCKSVVEHI